MLGSDRTAERRRYRENNKEKVNAGIRRWHAAHPEKAREYARKASRKRAGLPAPTRPCGDVCECCGCPAWLEVQALSLDHCHVTGKFRGWLCVRCNTGIGALGDNREGLLRAIAYLDRVK